MSAGAAAPTQELALHPGQTPLAYLLHALNQPLTGLQCSLELALVGERSAEYYLRCLRQGLDFTARMRVLVEAIRELADAQQGRGEVPEAVNLTALLETNVAELQPVAASKNVRLRFVADCPLRVEAGRRGLEMAIFRALDSAIAESALGSEIRLRAEARTQQAQITLEWERDSLIPPSETVSPASLAMLLARAGWEQAGAGWLHQTQGRSQGPRQGSTELVTIRMPLGPRPQASAALGANLHY